MAGATARHRATTAPKRAAAPVAGSAAFGLAGGTSNNATGSSSKPTDNTSRPSCSHAFHRSPCSRKPAIEAPTPSPKPAPAPSPELPTVSTPAPAASTNLPELWQQILGSLELPSTRMLLSQQAQLVRLDANRAVVQVAGNWMGMVQSRASLLEQAVAKALGGSRQLVLEASNSAMPPPLATAPIATTPVATAPAAVEPPTPAPAPTPAPSATPASASVPAPELPHTQAKPLDANPAAAPAESSPQASPPSGLDRQARNLADFFNGQVLDVDEVN